MEKSFRFYIVSDGTGETALQVTRAALVQYRHDQVSITRYQNIRSEKQIQSIVDSLERENSLLIYTLILPGTRATLKARCRQRGISCVDVLGPLLEKFNALLDSNKEKKPGLLRSVDEDYFKRIEATEFSLRHDDGKSVGQLTGADIVLVGVSRTSKTPLSLYLSFKGWKVANVPLVLGMPLPEDLSKVDPRRIIGLTIDTEHLIRIRKNRVKKFRWDFNREYAGRGHILNEMNYARELFEKHRWPVVNVTDRALEESAGEVLRILNFRMGWSENPLGGGQSPS